MAQRSSFFNSIAGDRKYRAEDWAEYFGSLIGNGYFAGDSAALQVIPGAGMTVVVRAGRAFVNGYYVPRYIQYACAVGFRGHRLPASDGNIYSILRF